MPLNVYYLDDEPELCELFKEIYESPDVQITTFTSPDEFIRTANDRPPQLAFIDFRLPGTTGDVVAGKLDQSFPKILITGEVLISAGDQFIRTLRKPCSVEDVSAVLTHFVATLG